MGCCCLKLQIALLSSLLWWLRKQLGAAHSRLCLSTLLCACGEASCIILGSAAMDWS